MNISFINTTIAVCLLWLLVFGAVIYISNKIYVSPTLTVHSYDIANNSLQTQTTQSQEKQQISLSSRLETGNLQNGIKVFGQCALCHTPVKNGSNRVGPPLWDVLNRPFAALKDYTYSRTMRAKTGSIWNFATLDAYLKSPNGTVPGTTMSFVGVYNDQDRADLLLYLRSLSDHPASLPSRNTSGEE